MLILLLMTGCQQQAEQEPALITTEPPASAASTCPLVDGPVMAGKLHGEISGDITADPGLTSCEGMSRPGDIGIRLRFGTRIPGSDDHLIAIFGIDKIRPGDTGEGIRTTVTLIDEARQRFFSTGEQNTCFSDVSTHEYDRDKNSSRIAGIVWCTAAIPQLNGERSVRMTEMNFVGDVAWRNPS